MSRQPAGERATLLILSYEGRHLLERHLPSVLRAARYAGGDHEVGVVDNASTDGTMEWLAREYPEVRRFPQARNDFLFSLNRAARELSTPYVVMLNNDLSVAEDFLPPLLEHFRDPRVFSVGATVFDSEKVVQARVTGRFSHGLLTPLHHVEQHLDPEGAGPQPTLYTPGGAAAFDRRRFLELGGFDRTFWPIYWEDVDVCYQAWKRGWISLHEPRSRVWVEDKPMSPTVKRFLTPRQVQVIRFKNSLVFTWKNVSDRRILWSSARSVLWYLRRSILRDRWRWEAVLWALRELPQILARRRVCAAGVPDREICREIFE